MAPNNSKSKLVLSVFVILLVVLLGAAVILSVFKTPAKNSPATQKSSGPAPVYAPKGQLTAGFPKELSLDQKAAVSQSYAITYDQAQKSYSAVFVSDQKIAALHALYKTYFTKNGWQILNESTKGLDGLYARKGQTDVNLTILSKDQQSQVTIIYALQ